MKLERRIADALDKLALHVDGDDVGGGDLVALTIALVNQNAIIANANAAMAVEVDNVGLLQHADAIGKLPLQGVDIGLLGQAESAQRVCHIVLLNVGLV